MLWLLPLPLILILIVAIGHTSTGSGMPSLRWVLMEDPKEHTLPRGRGRGRITVRVRAVIRRSVPWREGVGDEHSINVLRLMRCECS